MKLRKHQGNKWFLITFNSRPPGRTKTHRVWRAGSCKQSVLKAFLTGLDAGNMTTTIREATPLV